tara:strand:+ start:634 stop:1938 length:1305 start_codon:yes stop_codon:yes gene_type:complete
MATSWKKVLVSGSNIVVNQITASGITADPAADGTAKVLVYNTTTGAFHSTGSFSAGGGGSTTADLTDGNGIADFSFNGSIPATVAVEVDGSTLSVGTGGVKVANDGITTTQLADNAVTTDKITDGNVTTAKIADDAVTQAKIAAGAVGTTELADGAVTTIKITDANVTTAKLADDAVTQAKIAAGAVGTTEIADDAVTTAKIDANLGTLTGHSFTGSFTGSFDGDGSGLTGITGASTDEALTNGDGIATLNFNGSSAATVSVAGASALTDKTLVKWDDSAGEFKNSLITEPATGKIQIGADATSEVTIPGDLIVQGTASFQNEETLLVKDRYIVLNSGSSAGSGAGGIVIEDSNAGNDGNLFGITDNTGRWSVKRDFDPTGQSTFVPNAFMGLTSASAVTNPNATGTSGVNEELMKHKGNIFIDTGNDEIWIYA